MPKDVDVVYCDKHGPTMIKTYHFEDQEDIQGWYYFNNEPFLTKGALKIELEIKPKELEKIIVDESIETESVSNEWRTFTVFNLSDSRKVKDELEVKE